MLKKILAVAVLAAGMPAFAQSSSVSEKKDPNRKICERIEETGSRLAARRVCMTAQQWEDQRRLNRQDAERAQQGAVIKSSN